MTQPTLTLELPDEHATDRLGQALAHLAAALRPDALGKLLPGPSAGGRIHLKGDLGAGKTALVRAFLRQCSISGRIKSPSYALLESYEVSNLYFYHLDFYRFSENADWLDAGFRDLFKNNALVLIEWPERAGNLLSDPDLLIELSYAGLSRIATLSAYSEKGLSWINALPPLLTISRQTLER
ncbi:MAG: tRNA (adenosine(37)-N6)-threonylcarbamoyltransferase complex ATPase subunit type 1 TsaE [Burkholderiales bacterium]|nr:tRNA (adenosine(37)-N6)-threonylcarbamoyltransferase complex ATPase subunit type 1 TsaE [Burkholderiales bacterium]